MLSKPTIWLALVAVVAVSLAVVARNWSCRQPRPPRPPVVLDYDVASVDSGTSLTLRYGVRDRRMVSVTLEGIEVVAGREDAAKANLETLAGDRVGVQHGRLFGAEGSPVAPSGIGEAEQPESPPEAVRPPPTSGIFIGPNGVALQIGQLAAGVCVIVSGYEAPKEWRSAEKEGMRR